MSGALRPADTLLALLAVFILGVSFVAIKFGLQVMPPFALCAWRFFLAAIPLIFFVPRPDVSWRVLIGYGLAIFPSAAFLAAGAAFQSVYTTIKETGSSAQASVPLHDFQAFSQLMGFDWVAEFDTAHASSGEVS